MSPPLAADVGIQLSVAECKAVYDDRSALVHGAGIDLTQPHDRNEFGRRFNVLQATLRRVVRRAIEDPSFAAIFAENTPITSRWSTVVTSGGGVQRVI